MKKILLSVLALSMIIIWTSILSYPQAAKAYLGGMENTEFKDIRYLPNGYRVGVLGLAQLHRDLPATYMSTNSSVQIVKTNDKSPSKLKSVKITYMMLAYQFAGSNIQNVVKRVDESLTATCTDQGYATCNLFGGKIVTGLVLYPSIQLKIDMTFTDGSYTIYSAKNRIY